MRKRNINALFSTIVYCAAMILSCSSISYGSLSETSRCACSSGLELGVLSNWMSNNLGVLGDKRLSEICLPASHDSGMYKEDYGSPRCTIGARECNTRTQQLTVGDQLIRGVRVFDLRPVLDGKLYTGHFSEIEFEGVKKVLGCFGGDIESILNDVASFAAENPNELIILSFSHYYDRTASQNEITPGDTIKELVNFVQSSFLKQYLFKFPSSENIEILKLKYSDILKYGNVIALFDNIGGLEDTSIGILSSDKVKIVGSYANKADFNEMKDDQFRKFEEFNYDPENPSLFHLFWETTQSAEQAVACLDSEIISVNSIRKLASETNKHFVLIEHESQGKNKVPNIICSDFVDGTSTETAMRINGVGVDIKIPCSKNKECATLACGRVTAAEGASLVCCPSGEITTYAFYDYCTEMPNGSACWTDAMCASGNCKGSWYVKWRGTCS